MSLLLAGTLVAASACATSASTDPGRSPSPSSDSPVFARGLPLDHAPDCAGPEMGGGAPATPRVRTASPPNTLVVIDCEGRIVPGSAQWSVAGWTVTFSLNGEGGAALAEALVRAWPAAEAPPMRGLPVWSVTAIGARIVVEFTAEPVRHLALFADPRLGLELGEPREGSAFGADFDVGTWVRDRRDDIDAAAPGFTTRHDATIAYARSSGWSTATGPWDLVHLLIVPGLERGSDARWLLERVASSVVESSRTDSRMSAVGALSMQQPDGTSDAEFDPSTGRLVCPGPGGRPVGTTGSAEADGTGFGSIVVRADDPVATRLAERLVSASLRSDEADSVAVLLSTNDVRVRRTSSDDFEAAVRSGDASAYVLALPAAPHPCSLLGEANAIAPWSAPDRVYPLLLSRPFVLQPGEGGAP